MEGKVTRMLLRTKKCDVIVQPNVYINTVVEPVDSFCFNMNYFNGIVHIILCILILIL